MAKATIPDEVQVLRFFETGSLDRAEAVFNIVSEKMRGRLHGANRQQESAEQPSSPKRRSAQGNPKQTLAESAEHGPAA